MSDPLIAVILVPTFLSALAAASWFKTLDTGFVREARVPLVAGLVAGAALRFVASEGTVRPVATAVLLTLAALYVRLTGRESEPSDGMLLGAATGAAAACLFVTAEEPLLPFAECVLAATVGGYGITFGVTHTRNRGRQLAIDLLTCAVAVGAAFAPAFAAGAGFAPREIAIAAAAFVPLMALLATLHQWPRVTDELREEASLGVILDEDVRRTAHPFIRLGRGGWHSAGAHREFVRVATRIALRKRQLRSHPEPVARLYQLEVMKLRMEMQEMLRIDRAMREASGQCPQPPAASAANERSSDPAVQRSSES